MNTRLRFAFDIDQTDMQKYRQVRVRLIGIGKKLKLRAKEVSATVVENITYAAVMRGPDLLLWIQIYDTLVQVSMEAQDTGVYIYELIAPPRPVRNTTYKRLAHRVRDSFGAYNANGRELVFKYLGVDKYYWPTRANAAAPIVLARRGVQRAVQNEDGSTALMVPFSAAGFSGGFVMYTAVVPRDLIQLNTKPAELTTAYFGVGVIHTYTTAVSYSRDDYPDGMLTITGRVRINPSGAPDLNEYRLSGDIAGLAEGPGTFTNSESSGEEFIYASVITDMTTNVSTLQITINNTVVSIVNARIRNVTSDVPALSPGVVERHQTHTLAFNGPEGVATVYAINPTTGGGSDELSIPDGAWLGAPFRYWELQPDGSVAMNTIPSVSWYFYFGSPDDINHTYDMTAYVNGELAVYTSNTYNSVSSPGVFFRVRRTYQYQDDLVVFDQTTFSDNPNPTTITEPDYIAQKGYYAATEIEGGGFYQKIYAKNTMFVALMSTVFGMVRVVANVISLSAESSITGVAASNRIEIHLSGAVNKSYTVRGDAAAITTRAITSDYTTTINPNLLGTRGNIFIRPATFTTASIAHIQRGDLGVLAIAVLSANSGFAIDDLAGANKLMILSEPLEIALNYLTTIPEFTVETLTEAIDDLESTERAPITEIKINANLVGAGDESQTSGGAVASDFDSEIELQEKNIDDAKILIMDVIDAINMIKMDNDQATISKRELLTKLIKGNTQFYGVEDGGKDSFIRQYLKYGAGAFIG